MVKPKWKWPRDDVQREAVERIGLCRRGGAAGPVKNKNGAVPLPGPRRSRFSASTREAGYPAAGLRPPSCAHFSSMSVVTDFGRSMA